MTNTLPDQAPICVACVGDRIGHDGRPCLRCKGTGTDPDPIGQPGIAALAAVLEALDIPHAATMGDEVKRTAILIERAGHAVVMLRGILGGDAHPDIPWSVAYLRARLAEHPATGYKTWAEQVAELDAAKAQDGAR
jgi:hypothetical protein